MSIEHKVQKDVYKRQCQNGVTYLTDRRRERFPLLNEFGCRNTLLNSRPLCLREDFARLGVQTARLQFTIESPEECVRIARAFLSGAPLDGEFTNGLYKSCLLYTSRVDALT